MANISSLRNSIGRPPFLRATSAGSPVRKVVLESRSHAGSRSARIGGNTRVEAATGESSYARVMTEFSVMRGLTKRSQLGIPRRPAQPLAICQCNATGSLVVRTPCTDIVPELSRAMHSGSRAPNSPPGNRWCHRCCLLVRGGPATGVTFNVRHRRSLEQDLDCR